LIGKGIDRYVPSSGKANALATPAGSAACSAVTAWSKTAGSGSAAASAGIRGVFDIRFPQRPRTHSTPSVSTSSPFFTGTLRVVQKT